MQPKPSTATNSPEFEKNRGAMQALVDDLKAKLDVISQGGGEEARNRHTSRGKLLPRAAN